MPLQGPIVYLPPPPVSTAQVVAGRWKQAALFNVGDPVLYGKYKNKKGIILKFVKDDKGYPAVEIEQLPNPTGRKEKKVLTLFKIRKSPKPFKKKKKTAERVVARFLESRGVPMGKTLERGNVRVHRSRDSLVITDLTNVGQRGKRVQILSVTTGRQYQGDPQGWLDRMSKAVIISGDFDYSWRFVKELKDENPGEVILIESKQRGIDVQG